MYIVNSNDNQPKEMYLNRDAEQTLRQLSQWYPIVAVTGPRQSGKTTLVRHLMADKAYITLEELDQREFAGTDPRGFLSQYPDGAIFDEIHHVPTLLSYLQTMVDNDRRKGLFILTGSQQFGLRDHLAQTLAGRVGLLELLPLSLSELFRRNEPVTLAEQLWLGGYPRIRIEGIPPAIWLSDYINTYLERDVRRLLNVRNLGSFQRFLRMCAARTGQLLNLSALAADCGITHNTAKEWVSVLEASYIIYLLQPYHQNLGKRLVKTPKLYFLDTALAAWLVNVKSPEELALGNLRGPLFESLVVGEILKWRLNRRQNKDIYFWRDSNGHEIDLLIEEDGSLLPIECKAGQTVATDWFGGIEKFLDITGSDQAWLIYGGDQKQQRKRVSVIGWQGLAAAMDLPNGSPAGQAVGTGKM